MLRQNISYLAFIIGHCYNVTFANAFTTVHNHPKILKETFWRKKQELATDHIIIRHSCHTSEKTRISMTLIDDDLITRSQAIARSLAFPLGFATAFRTGAAISVIGQPRLPDHFPSTNNNRNNDYGNNNINNNNIIEAVGSRIIRLPKSGARVRLFYPAALPISSSMKYVPYAPYCTDGRLTSDGMAGLVGFRQLGLSFLLAHLADATSGCYKDVQPLVVNSKEGRSRFPLLVYSHGYGGNMDMATYFLRAIASTGTVVAAVEHTDGTASSTQLKDGTMQPFSPNLMTGREQLSCRAEELLEVYEMLVGSENQLQSSSVEEEFGNIIDPTKVFLGGHSYGAPSALLAAFRASKENQKGISTTRDVNIAGIILHDPALAMGYDDMLGDNNDNTMKNIPTISYTSDEYNRAGVRYGDSTVHVKGAFHGNFVDAPLWAPSWVMRPLSAIIPAAGPANPNQVHDELANSAAAFMASRKVHLASVMEGRLFELVE